MLLSRFIPAITVLLLLSAVPSITAQVPADYIVALRETQIQEGLGLYPNILGTAQAKQRFPLIELKEDEYGISWAHVQLDDEKTGYLTDIIAIRMPPEDLDSILAEVSEEELAGWDQETIESIRGAQLEVGMSRTQVLLARGVPRGSRLIGNVEELTYPREKILLADGAVTAFTDVKRLLLDKAVRLQFDPADSAFTPNGGRWQDSQVGEQTFRVDVSGTGVGRFRVQVPTEGTYRFTVFWMVTEQSSTSVTYRISHRKEEIARFRANQRLHNLREVELGTITLPADGTTVIEVSTEDESPFSVGMLSLVYINEPLPVE